MATVLRAPKLTALEIQARQAELVIETYETLDEPKHLRHERTKPGDPETMRGFPILVECGMPGRVTSDEDLGLCLKCGHTPKRCRCQPAR